MGAGLPFSRWWKVKAEARAGEGFAEPSSVEELIEGVVEWVDRYDVVGADVNGHSLTVVSIRLPRTARVLWGLGFARPDDVLILPVEVEGTAFLVHVHWHKRDREALDSPRGFFLVRSKEELRGLVERVLREFYEHERRRLTPENISYLLMGRSYEWVTIFKDGMMLLSSGEC
jgi:hypothetical protein